MKPLQACRIFLKRASDIKNSQLHARHGLFAAKKRSSSGTCTKRMEKQTAESLLQSKKKGVLPLDMGVLANMVVFPPKSPMPCATCAMEPFFVHVSVFYPYRGSLLPIF